MSRPPSVVRSRALLRALTRISALCRRAILSLALAATIISAPLTAQGPSPVGLRNVTPPPTYQGTAFFVESGRGQTNWKEGMFIGAGVGLLAGLLLTSLVLSTCEQADCHSFKPTYVLGPIFVFAILGGMIGDASRR